MAWSVGPVTLGPGQSGRWSLTWDEGDPGQQVVGVHPITPGSELQYTTPGVQLNSNCSLTYWLTVTNVGSSVATFYFRGTAI